jgi:hypothetical protein
MDDLDGAFPFCLFVTLALRPSGAGLDGLD